MSSSMTMPPPLEYNATTPAGPDVHAQDVNTFYASGDIAWIITATALVLLMIPGVG
jgi:Amt family ammonium transporter